MKLLNLIFFFHNHQPFDYPAHLMEEAYQKAYLPFLQVFDRHPKFKLCLYYSASLFEFFEKQHPEILDILERMNQRRQIELLSGAYYEPILPLLPQSDQVGQIKLMNDYIRKKFGTAPRGAWLPFKAWEPALVSALSQTGIEYIMAEDLQLKQSGATRLGLKDYFITEKEGDIIKVFPVSSGLSTHLPLKPLREFAQHLYSLIQEERKVAVVTKLGEEFGFTSGSTTWVYQEEYLEQLLSTLESSELLQLTTFSDYLEDHVSHQRIYLKPYLDPKLEKAIGGPFQSTLIKFEEANWIHKRGQLMSQRLRSLESNPVFLSNPVREAKLIEARRYLYATQANYLFWLGEKGGLALPGLRKAAYGQLIKVEKILDELQRGGRKYADLSVVDFDMDDEQEAIISSEVLSLYYSNRLGSFIGLDYKPKNVNLFDTLSDYPRSDADPLLFAEKLLPIRTSLKDYFLPIENEIRVFENNQQDHLNLFKHEEYVLFPTKKPSEVSVRSSTTGTVNGKPVKIVKTASLLAGQPQIGINLQIENLSSDSIELFYATSLNYRALDIKNKEQPEERIDFSDFKLVDDELKISVTLESVKKTSFFRHPVYTVIRHEAKVVKAYQGTELALGWKMKLGPKERWENGLKLSITS